MEIAAGALAVLVDDEDGDLAGESWFVNSHGYAVGNGPSNYGLEKMHRVIMRRMAGRPLLRHELVDHANGNRLDNRRANLRLCNNSENAFNADLPANNTTGYKGVYRNSPGNLKPWQAAITVNRKKQYLGSYHTPEDAARAYDEAARRLAGEFARGNFR